MDSKKGFGLDTVDRIQNEGISHFELIEKIEKITKRNLICYTSNFPHPAGSLTDEDDGIIETVLKSVNLSELSEDLDLLIHTRGGSPLAAYKIVQTCRVYCKNFRVVIPKTAMSAGTLIAMGADSILMRQTAEIGPIDPQMLMNTPNGPVQRPAMAWVEAYQELIKKAQESIKKGEPPQPYLQQLSLLDPTWIQVCLQARDLSKSIAITFLKNYMLRTMDENSIGEIVDRFITTGERLSHGLAIRAEEAKSLGLNVEIIQNSEEIDLLFWELLERTQRYVQSRGFSKYVIGRKGGLNVKIEPLKIF